MVRAHRWIEFSINRKLVVNPHFGVVPFHTTVSGQLLARAQAPGVHVPILLLGGLAHLGSMQVSGGLQQGGRTFGPSIKLSTHTDLPVGTNTGKQHTTLLN